MFLPSHFTGVLLLFLKTALTTEESVGLSSIPSLTAPCDQSLRLFCNITKLPAGTKVKMSWVHHKPPRVHRTLCEVDSENPTRGNGGEFTCSLRDVHLELTLQQPVDEGSYTCKLHSAAGITNNTTLVMLDDCYENVSAALTPEGPSCVFTRVRPDGDVHWFHASQRLHEPVTTKRVEEDGSVTVKSTLGGGSGSGQGPYNCSLWNSGSKRYLTSRLVETSTLVGAGHYRGVLNDRNRAWAHGADWKQWGVLLLLLFVQHEFQLLCVFGNLMIDFGTRKETAEAGH